MRLTKKRSPQTARAYMQRLDAHMLAVSNKFKGRPPSADAIHNELRKRTNLIEIFGIDMDMLAYAAEHIRLTEWLRGRQEFIAPIGNEKAGSRQRSWQHDGTGYVHLIAVLAEATRDPNAEDATERRKQGRKIILGLKAHYEALGKPYEAQAKLLGKIAGEVSDKSVVFQQPLMPPDEFTA